MKNTIVDPNLLLKSLEEPIKQGRLLNGHSINPLTNSKTREALATFIIYTVLEDKYRKDPKFRFEIIYNKDEFNHDGYITFTFIPTGTVHVYEIEHVLVVELKGNLDLDDAIINMIKKKHEKKYAENSKIYLSVFIEAEGLFHIRKIKKFLLNERKFQSYLLIFLNKEFSNPDNYQYVYTSILINKAEKKHKRVNVKISPDFYSWNVLRNF